MDAASNGDVIKIAQGTYTGAQTKLSATTGYTYTQVVLVDNKSLTLQGGYTTGDWNRSDPLAHPTVIDAQHHGRGITVLGPLTWAPPTLTVTVAGLQIVNGDYTNLGNPPGVANAACPSTGGDCAGGLLAYRVKLILRDTLIRNNTASRLRLYSDAGGALLWETGDSLIENTRVFSNTNTVDGYGGGMEIHYATGNSTIRNCQFDQNHSTYDGGGLLLNGAEGPTVIEDSRFVGNSAVGSNTTRGGGIAALMPADLTLNRVEFRDNRAAWDGAALYIRQVGRNGPTLSLTNVLAAGNQLEGPQPYGATFNITEFDDFNVRMRHVTVAENQTPGAIRIAQDRTYGISFQVAMTNTLVTSATYGVVGAHYRGVLTINQTNSLFHNVTNQTYAEDGSPTFNTTGTVSGDPKLDANQRLHAGSAAIDAGVDSGVHLDLDGGVRPAGAGYDIGADEYNAGVPGALRFGQATYAVPEGDSIIVTVERVGGTTGSVSVHYATSDGTASAGSDYTAASGTLTFADGETSKTFTVRTLQDTTHEADETFVLSLSHPTGGATLGNPHQAVVTIRDDDVGAAGAIHFSRSHYTVHERDGAAIITVVRTGGSQGAVSVQYTTGDDTARAGSDYTATSGTLHFADGETSKTFTVPIIKDTVPEQDETVNLVLSNVTGGAMLVTPNQAVLTITEKYNTYLPLTLRRH